MAVSSTSSTSSASSTGALSSSRQTIAQNFDTFLQLLTTQLKNQNPLDPLDTNQFTQQLVQFTGVEQQLKTNDYLAAMMEATQNSTNTQAVSYVGKVITADGTKTQLTDGAASWRFSVPKAATITASVVDANGNTVFTKTGNVAQGESVFQWDGIGNDGKAKADGAYSLKISAKDSDGKVVSVATQMAGEVTGVDFSGGEPVLLLGTGRVTLSAVNTVSAKTTATTGT
jgi:flagellar basal-body rod modification protein FlgD